MQLEKVIYLANTLNGSGDAEALELISDFINSASEYVSRVVDLETARLICKSTMNANEYRETIQGMDELRSRSHNSLISNIKVMNRLCKNNGLKLIYEGNEDDRVEIADFAKDVVTELFNKRKL